MAQAIISRTGSGSPSVTLELEDTGRGLAVARDIGKPSVNFNAVGKEDPLPQDHFNASDVWTVSGKLRGANAYADAQTLAEDIIKPQFGDSDELNLDLSDLPNRSTYEVAPATAGAASLTYNPGVRKVVDVQLSLTNVNDTFSGGGQAGQATQSPASGSGIKLTDGSNPVTLQNGLTVTRTVGRPENQLIKRPGALPNYYDLNKPAVDQFDISGVLTSASAEADAQTLEETLIRSRQGTDALTLHFLSNEFGLDAYDVLPDSSQSLRTSFSTGETGIVRVERLQLRVVDTQ